MSVIQVEDLVSYQLRTSYLNDIADGVGERLLTVNETLINTAPFKAAGWRPTSSHKRTHSPPIPTAIASEYFQAPRHLGFSLEDGEDDGGMLTHGGADTMGPGIATKRRRRREQMEEDDSSDLTDESEEEQDQRDAQRIKFAKMPLRHRAGSSPLQNTALRQPFGSTSPKAVRRGSQSALETVKERARRDTVTSSEISSESEFDVPHAQRHREAARAAARTLKLQEKINEEPTPGIKRADTTLLPEEEEDSDEVSDISEDYVESIDSASILNVVETGSPTHPVVGNPPREYRRKSMRKSQLPSSPAKLSALPPPRPLSTIRPLSIVQPSSLLTQGLKAKELKPSIPFQKFAHYSGQGTPGSIAVRIYPAYAKTASRPFEVPIRPRVSDGQGAERAVTVADLIGLSLYRYNEEKREPRLPRDKLNLNWWTLRMVEEGGEVDDDFPPFERTKPLVSFTTVHNAALRGGGRMRSNSRAFDDFALVLANEDEYETNKKLTPQEDEIAIPQPAPVNDAKEVRKEPLLRGVAAVPSGFSELRQNPIVTTTYRPNTPLADAPQTPNIMPNTNRGQQRLLRVHIMSSDTVPGQMVTVDVTTDTYLEEVLDLVCRKRQLDKANHVLRLPGSGAVAMVDRPVSSIGNVSDLELYRRRFATDGPLAMTGSPSSASPRFGAATSLPESHMLRRANKQQRGAAGTGAPMMGVHPLAREALKQDELGGEYKKYTVWRKQPMRLVLSERLLMIDGEYIHIVPASGGKALHDSTSKTTTVHFSNVIGCKVARKHPTNIKLVVYKAAETKRYEFEARNAEEAAEIVNELKRGVAPYNREV